MTMMTVLSYLIEYNYLTVVQLLHCTVQYTTLYCL